MRKSLWCVPFVVSGFVAGAAALHASGQPEGAGGHGHHGHHGVHGLHGGQCDLAAALHAHLAQLHADLNLTDEQRDAVHATFVNRHADIAAAVRPVLQAKRTLINAVHADAPDEAAIRAAGDTLGRAIGDAAVVFAHVKNEVFQAAAWTPEQTRKLGEMKTKLDVSIGRLVDSLQPAAENPHR
jgi:Spy/CpxP family protein refolding chaperone